MAYTYDRGSTPERDNFGLGVPPSDEVEDFGAAHQPVVEIDSRKIQGGVDVKLMLDRVNGRLNVEVNSENGAHMVLSNLGATALDAFAHPFAYASDEVDTREFFKPKNDSD